MSIAEGREWGLAWRRYRSNARAAAGRAKPETQNTTTRSWPGAVDPEGVDGNIHTNGLEHIRCIDCESEQNEWSRDREIRVCEEPRKETDYVKDRPSATSDMIPRPRPGDTFNDPPDPGSWARAERRQCQGATTIQLLPLQLYGTEKYGPALLEPLEREQVRSVVWALLLPAQKVKSSHALL